MWVKSNHIKLGQHVSKESECNKIDLWGTLLLDNVHVPFPTSRGSVRPTLVDFVLCEMIVLVSWALAGVKQAQA